MERISKSNVFIGKEGNHLQKILALMINADTIKQICSINQRINL